ncbi:MAG: DUF3365 domain-containing protein [Phycisphaerales bacterium]
MERSPEKTPPNAGAPPTGSVSPLGAFDATVDPSASNDTGGASGSGSGSASPAGSLGRAAEGLEQIGPYQILQMLGEGGFGFVYMAQQTHPVRRRVAIKILKPGMDSRQIMARFDGERQALAMMDHPNIARVLDAGTTPTGRPFFVMELVKGIPITEYCDSSSLSTRERLELFIGVCDALHHAHQKGIVHRDIKPGNVLVTMHHDKHSVKVIDFGIAKALNQDLSDDPSGAAVTQIRQFIGTPQYMAPEQAGSGIDVDTRSDVYSLGVLLYELITGMTPFEHAQLRGKSMLEVQKMLKEFEPPRPSTKIAKATKILAPDATREGTLADQIARHRRTDPAALRKSLTGELDWIVMKCLEKDRRRRYDSAAALGDDVRRYLNDEAIEARPATAAYRFRKFARRNKLALGASGGLVMAMFLSLIALAYGLHEAQLERDKTAERETVTRAQMLLSSMNAVRAYTTGMVRPALQAHAGSYEDFKPEMVPAYSARQVFEKFRTANDDYRHFKYKEASVNPTNAEAKADPFEEGLVEDFTRDRSKKETQGLRVIDGRRHLFIARPMAITDAACLDCHTTPEKAPPRQVELYGRDGGYGWSMGQVIAAQVVYVPVAEAFRAGDTGYKSLMITLVSIFVLGGVIVVIVLSRA